MQKKNRLSSILFRGTEGQTTVTEGQTTVTEGQTTVTEGQTTVTGQCES
ncbi:MAG: hypothetical protein GY822_00950 [Deltaproteobacteria bacterium]|nr:hypothetical protein [Deltaproteobacteria bacterium]